MSFSILTSFAVVELTAAGTGVSPGHFAQFLAGRVIVYISVGLVEVNITSVVL